MIDQTPYEIFVSLPPVRVNSRIDRWTSDRSLENPNQKIGRKSMAVRVIRDKPVEDNATVTPNQAFSGPHVSQPTADYVTTFNPPPTENEL